MANYPNAETTTNRTLTQFRSKLTGGGARPNLFECELSFPSGVGYTPDDTFRMLVKAASLPASTIGIIDVPFRGRNLKIAGDRTFDPWSITVINDVDFKIRTAFEQWMNLINKHQDNAGKLEPSTYQEDVFVKQLGRTPFSSTAQNTSSQQIPVLKAYKFYGVFPTSVSAIDLSYDSTDTIEEFTVDLQVQWWDALDSNGQTQLGSVG